MTLNNTYTNPIGVVGAGRFGVAIANLLAKKNKVLLFARRQEIVDTMRYKRIAARQHLAEAITPTSQLKELIQCCNVIFIIVPASAFKNVILQLAPYLRPYHILIHGTKGLSINGDYGDNTYPKISRACIRTMSEIIEQETVVVKTGCISGPNLVGELAQNQPAAAVIASKFEEVTMQGQKLLKNDIFQVYSSVDIVGVELCGALKNIMAIGAGCLNGLGYGDNIRALLISRGIVEMIYIGRIMGASIQPFIGLAGVGDLVATCSNNSSRNHTLGYRLAQGESFQAIMASMDEIIEGINTVKIIKALVASYPIRVPITEMVYRILFDNVSVQDALAYLMKYPFNVDIDFF